MSRRCLTRMAITGPNLGLAHFGSTGVLAAQIDNQGGNLCGCPAPVGECQLLSTGIGPPPPLGD